MTTTPAPAAAPAADPAAATPPPGPGELAAARLREALAVDPERGEDWLELCWHLTVMSELDEARRAEAQYLRTLATEAPLRKAARLLAEDRLPEADFLLREYQRGHPPGFLATRLAAEVAFRRDRDPEAIALFGRCLELEPARRSTHFNRALAHFRAGDPVAAQADVEAALAAAPDNPAWLALLAAVLSKTSEVERTLGIYERLVAAYPRQPRIWMSYGHVLKAAGRQPDSVAAYRRALQFEPRLGEAWWSLANLKTVRFGDADVAAMEAQLARTDLSADDRLHFEFALGKALEDARRYEPSFRHYAEGNRLRLAASPYHADANTEHLRRSQRILTRGFFAARAGVGCPAPDPIFILGLPRSGSTLLEQILASHPLVEGTMELSDVTHLARSLADRRGDAPDYDYLPILPELQPHEWRELGESYLATTRVHRKLGRPFFIDKMPNNNAHVGLIHLMLPNARIIDARRHPMASCFSNFKQHFAVGQLFSYGLENIGRYYRDYVELMAHFDAVLPGRVHRVIYERVVEDTEAEIRRLLDYCGLPFDERCLRFWENDRIIRTASSEQVRKPIYRDGVDHWRHYQPWLGPLEAALGPVLEAYPEVPEFAPAPDAASPKA